MKFRSVVRELPLAGLSLATIHAALRPHGWNIILESGRGGRYTYLFGPYVERVSVRGDEGTVVTCAGVDRRATDPWTALETMLNHEVESHPSLAAFNGGIVGFMSYDLARTIERLEVSTLDDLLVPDIRFDRVDRFIQIDHHANTVIAAALVPIDDPDPHDLLDTIASVAGSAVACADDALVTPRARRRVLMWNSNMNRMEFESMVRRSGQYIHDGDVFQVNLSIRFDTSFDGDPLEVYRALRAINPSPYMAFLEYDDLAIASASPELLLKVTGRRIETRPIAGTRRRGETDEEDVRLEQDLLTDEKEQAEHLMLVDLERNDIGRVAKYGSVRVDEFMTIERYSHVLHIVSHISGQLAERSSTLQAVRSLFPGGTITGAPKVRSMEIIEELEPTRRGIYTGSIGWMSFDGNCEFNIAIRTVVVSGERAYVQAGAGIVADSDPSSEYRESVRKAQAGMDAVSEAVHAKDLAPRTPL